MAGRDARHHHFSHTLSRSWRLPGVVLTRTDSKFHRWRAARMRSDVGPAPARTFAEIGNPLSRGGAGAFGRQFESTGPGCAIESGAIDVLRLAAHAMFLDAGWY